MARFDWEGIDWSRLGRGWREDLHLAATLLTRLPLAPLAAIAPGREAEALRAAPIVGLALGLGGGLVFALARGLGLGPALAGLLALATMIAASGALHEDGLADFADALGGGSPEARLAIMRDSRLGSYGVLALLLTLGLRAGALAEIARPGAAALALAAAAAGSRAVMPLLAFLLEPARPEGFAAKLGRPSQEAALTAAALGAAASLALLGIAAGIVAAAAAGAAACGIAALARARLGGYTGDVLGAAQQAAEVAILLVAAVFAQ